MKRLSALVENHSLSVVKYTRTRCIVLHEVVVANSDDSLVKNEVAITETIICCLT